MSGHKRRRIESVPLLTAVRWDWRAAAAPPSTSWGNAGSSCSAKYADDLLGTCVTALQKKRASFDESIDHQWITSTEDVWRLVKKVKAAGGRAPEGSHWYRTPSLYHTPSSISRMCCLSVTCLRSADVLMCPAPSPPPPPSATTCRALCCGWVPPWLARRS